MKEVIVMPTAEAQRIYRQAWQQYLLTTDDNAKRGLEQLMNSCQEACVSTRGPGPEWEAFIDTLPGYRAHWESLATECEAMARDLEARGKLGSCGEGTA
jgi:hypothetical protein